MNTEVEPTITIPLQEYLKFLHFQAKLEALEANGVDNWEGYDLAMEELQDQEE